MQQRLVSMTVFKSDGINIFTAAENAKKAVDEAMKSSAFSDI
jgi:hypothetical protein